jgi:hypothetical protein
MLGCTAATRRANEAKPKTSKGPAKIKASHTPARRLRRATLNTSDGQTWAVTRDLSKRRAMDR